jgi:DNA-binding transcriptional MerR regulator
MFRISEFSRLTRVSIKMLRHYDQLGLLTPAHTDPQSGYRFYTIAQLPRLHRLIALKDLGFSLDQVARLLAENLSAFTLQTMLEQRESELLERISLEQQRLTEVRQHLEQLREAATPANYDVVVRDIPAQLVASIRAIVPELDDSITQLFDTLELHVAQRHARAAAAPGLVYHDRELREQQADVEVVVPLKKPIPATNTIRVGELAGGTMACLLYRGSYSQFYEAWQALIRWAEASRYQIDGPLREVYLQFGATHAAEMGLPGGFLTHHVDHFVTEMQLPVLVC